MPTRERPVERGDRRAREDLFRIGAELRQGRVSSGLSLARLGRAVDLSPSQISRIERALAPSVTVRQLARLGAVVGLDVRVRTYPGPDPLRDVAHVRLLDRLRVRLHPDLTFRTEVPLPNAGDQRAWDAWIGGFVVASRPNRGLPVEGETRITDFQAIIRRVMRKVRDGGADDVLLLVADTRANRLAIMAAGAAVSELFPVTPRRALSALAVGEHPNGSALVFL
jgi:transcriptional regulator with XRE-family HTH domain